ncbi:hypothetical protein NKR23_g4162 [Pleurostoma richardsiae]|uniref:Uncharacterized protein n=1 Tax=Pleurostoma richardsiae TaxID=41990 RepID=A0AA38S316_9PEZI|nr:hypothetical protein NKR23_g4162 [Pleurostoma richardsiae]
MPAMGFISRAALLALLLTLVAHRAASFSLDVSGPDWDYTTTDLANTTSQACKDAYSAEIDCDDTLLGIVASMRPAFDPTVDDYDRMCVQTCSDALDAYVAGVKAACNQPGDLAKEAEGNSGVPKDPVEVVGEVFQYSFAQACRNNDTGYCHFIDSSVTLDFGCNDTCMVDFYTNAHDMPGSHYSFNYYYLGPISDWWEQEFDEGWEMVRACSGDVASITGVPTATTGSSPAATGESTVELTASPASTGDETVTGTAAVTETGTASAQSASGSGGGSTSAASSISRPMAALSLLLVSSFL